MRFACNDCRKKFRTEGALEMHLKDKHSTKFRNVQQSRGRQIGFWGACLAGALGGFVAAAVMIGGAAAVMLREGGIITLTTSPQMQEKAAVVKALLPSAVIRR